jgi:hypothetical protein
MKLFPTWPITAGALAVGLIIGAGADHLWMDAKLSRAEVKYDKLVSTHAEQERKRQLQRAEDERTARTDEQRIADLAGEKLQEKENAKNSALAERDAAIARLQSRPGRQPARPSTAAPASPTCTGTTGAELSRPDAEFLVGEASRADVLRAALQQCYGQYEAAREVTNAVPAPAQ